MQELSFRVSNCQFTVLFVRIGHEKEQRQRRGHPYTRLKCGALPPRVLHHRYIRNPADMPMAILNVNAMSATTVNASIDFGVIAEVDVYSIVPFSLRFASQKVTRTKTINAPVSAAR
jgi:hypothetical protein